MFSNQYDTALATWTPAGRLHRVEYCTGPLKQRGAVIGLSSDAYVAFASANRPTSEFSLHQRHLFKVSDHIGIAMAGLTADGRALCHYTRSESIDHKFVYESPVADAQIPIIDYENISMHARRIPTEEHLEDAVQIVDLMIRHNIRVSINTFSSLLQRCTRERDLGCGKKVHLQLLENGYKSNILLANTLLVMYGRCGSPLDAQKVFSEMPKHNVYSWSFLINAYAYEGMAQEAVSLLYKMQKAGQSPDKAVFVALLQACGSAGALGLGKEVHELISKTAFRVDLTIRNNLIDMYVKCGRLKLGYEMFIHLPERDAFSWTVMIRGYARKGLTSEAFQLFEQMDIEPDEDTFAEVLHICADVMDVTRGEWVYSQAISAGGGIDLCFAVSMIDMYVKCNDLGQACRIFNKMDKPDGASWNILVQGHLRQGLGRAALILFERMQFSGMQSDETTLRGIIEVCQHLASEGSGRLAHDNIVKTGCEVSACVQNSLISLYLGCGNVLDAKYMFDCMPEKDLVSWMAIITGFSRYSFGAEAKDLFLKLRDHDFQLDKDSLVSLLGSCCKFGDLAWANQLHAVVIEYGFSLEVDIRSMLVDMYARCEYVEQEALKDQKKI